MIATLTLIGLAFVGTWAGVLLFRRWSVRRNVLDIPNERSSHSAPTPRGGGLVIVIVSLLGYAAIAIGLDAPFSVGFFVGAIIISSVSWLDDLYSIPFWSRLIAHVAASLVLVWDAGVLQTIWVPLLSVEIQLGYLVGLVLTVLWVVWLVNAYNFMDGIDGIAALQAVIAGIAWAVILYALDIPGASLFAAILASSSLGFLIHNWQPARIFMGDVGSAFLGFTLAAMPLVARTGTRDEMSGLPVFALLLVWFFVLDSVFTLVNRALQGERVWEAHRQHLYQRMVIAGRQHATVSLIYGSSAALLSLMACLSVILVGNYTSLAVLLILVLTSLVVYVAYKKSVDVNG